MSPRYALLAFVEGAADQSLDRLRVVTATA
jgi:hypothetical protein